MHGDVLLVRGGGSSWFGGRSDYDEFPPDFDYEDDDDDDNGAEDVGGGSGSTAFCWPEDDEEPATPPARAEKDESTISSKLDLKDFLEEEDALMKDEQEEEEEEEQEQEQGRRSGRPADRKKKGLPSAGFGQGRGGSEGSFAASPAPGLKRYVLVSRRMHVCMYINSASNCFRAVCVRGWVWFENRDNLDAKKKQKCVTEEVWSPHMIAYNHARRTHTQTRYTAV